MTKVISLVGCLLVMSMAVSATAAPGWACKLVVDERGDSDIAFEPNAVTNSSSLDVVSADVASNDRLLTAVIRVDELVSLDPRSPAGSFYQFMFTAQRSRFHLEAGRTVDGELFQLWVVTSSVGDENGGSSTSERRAVVDGVFDEDASEIRITAPLSAFRPHAVIARGTTISGFSITTFRGVGNSGATGPGRGYSATMHSSDHAKSTATYRAGSPSCVMVGA